VVAQQVALSSIIRDASTVLYHSSEQSAVEQISEDAARLDNELESWRRRLPDLLDFDHVSLKEPEWASKQKLSLQIRKIPFYELRSSFKHTIRGFLLC